MHLSMILRGGQGSVLRVGILAVLLTASLCAQTTSPSAAAPSQSDLQPSSWFNQQTGELGLAGFDSTSVITSECYLRTGFGELMFFSGPNLEPTSARGPTLEKDGRPIIHCEFERDSITYRFTIFAAKIDKSAIINARQHAKFPFMPGFNIESGIVEPEVDFVRVVITNSDHERRRAVFASGVRYQDPNATGARQNSQNPGRQNPRDVNAGEAFNPGWTNNFDDANFYRFNRALYNFSAGYADRSFNLRKNWSAPNPQYVLGVTRLDPTPTTPIGIATYARELNPGETWTLNFKLPLIPTADPFVISAIDDANLDVDEPQVHSQAAAQQ
ncbi:MAG TPA: hypothetical protein VGG45_03445 [Terracidiphilus sp.]